MIQGEDGQVHISISQDSCNRITIRRDTGYLGKVTIEKHSLKLDGAVQDDSSWFGGRDRYKTSAKFSDASLRIAAKSSSGMTLTVIYSLTPKRDLMEDALFNGRRAGGPIVAIRQN